MSLGVEPWEESLVLSLCKMSSIADRRTPIIMAASREECFISFSFFSQEEVSTMMADELKTILADELKKRV